MSTLHSLNLHSLELRRLRTDLHKIVFGLVCLNFGDFFKYCPVSTTRGHPYKLYTSHCTSICSRFFANRVIKAWNSLPQSTNFSSLAAFKRSILRMDVSKHLTMLFVCPDIIYTTLCKMQQIYYINNILQMQLISYIHNVGRWRHLTHQKCYC